VVTGLAAGVAIGFDHAYVFAFDALADGRSDQAQKHGPIAGTSERICPCDSTQDYRDSQSYSAIHSKIPVPTNLQMCATHPSNFNHFRQPTLSKVSNMG
jgi:hypothetical protein